MPDPIPFIPAAAAERAIIDLEPESLASWASQFLADGYRLALVAAHDDSPSAAHGPALRVVYLFTDGPPDSRIELHVRLDPHQPQLPSLAALSFPAGRFEREMGDLYGIVPLNHPLPRRLVRHHHWPRGWHPMRADAGPPPAFGEPEGPYPFLAVEGPGVYEIPVGPVHAGLIEPGHFRFSVVGETILKLKARLWFVHKGIEKLAEGRLLADVLPLAERVSGDTAVGHALAFCLAVEEARDWRIPADAATLRAILFELERLYNHTTDIGALCNDVGYGVINAHAQRIREQLLRLNKHVTGHRLLRSAIVPGASGIDHDARRDHPFTPATTDIPPSRHTDGDVLARFLTRADEIQTSIQLITQLLETAPATVAERTKPTWLAAGRASGVGLVEGWRGTIAHRIEMAPDGTVSRLKIVDPSFFNWPALPVALADTIVPDFPLTNKSFNLSYAGNDL